MDTGENLPGRKNWSHNAKRKRGALAPLFSFLRPPPSRDQSRRTSPSRRTAASREGAAASGTVRPPRAPRTVGPSSRRKAFWEGRGAFFASALGSRKCSAPSVMAGPSVCAASWSLTRPGAGQGRAAALRVMRRLSHPGRPRGSCALSPWRAEGSGLGSATLPVDRRRHLRRPSGCLPTPGNGSWVGLSAFEFLGHRLFAGEVSV